ncbi:O-antigen ligase family protein [Candidatus Kaiserbacteria bacterium]|nr:O-antigen ligase family protein [Candidatus Kaiserbacteria bacterium]
MDARQIARYVALGALFLVPLTPLIVVDSFFFPFITGKAFYFRIVTEIAVAAWAVLMLVDKAYRPRFSWLGVAVLVFVAWMSVADAFAPNAAKAFWSNFERMEGWILLVHLLGFFGAASAVLGAEKKWRAWFLSSLAVSLIVSAYALLQIAGRLAIHQGATRIDASFGNSAYLAIYLLFNIFIALSLAFSERRPWLRYSLGGLALLEGVLLFFTETRGTVLALAAALVLAALLAAWKLAHRRARLVAALALALIIFASAAFYAARDTSFVRSNHTLQRIASISLSDGQTRFTIWKMALAGVGERPVSGWGQEGFNYIFNAHYDPSLHTQEPWFDRAHSAFIDWLTAGGVPAFLLYVSLFGLAFWYLWRPASEASRHGPQLSAGERIALTAALVGYAVHNMFVFDNLYSYVYFFAILAYIDSKVALPSHKASEGAARPMRWVERAPVLSESDAATYALPVAAVGALVVIWTVNISGMQTAGKLITALTPSNDLAKNISVFEELAKNPSFAAQEIREQMVTAAGAIAQNPAAPQELKQRMVTLAIAEMQKQVAAYPRDARGRLQLSYAYRAAGDGARALEEMEAAVALSPRKEGFYVEKGALELDLGETKAAQADFLKAYELGPQFSDLAIYAALGHFAAGDQAAADAILVSYFGTTEVDSDILAIAYLRTKNWPRLISMLAQRTEKPGAPPQAWFALASAEYQSGNSSAAIRTLRAAADRFPEAAAAANSAIAQIQAQ